MNHEEIEKALYFRHACKVFDPTKKIPEKDIKLILESARLSPSSFGLEGRKFLILQNKKLREKIIPFTWGAEKGIPTASHVIIILSRKSIDMIAESDYTNKIFLEIQKVPEKIKKIFQKYLKSFQENDLCLNTEEKIDEWSSKQAYIPLTNMMTIASLLGIDSCAIEGFNFSKMNKFLEKDLKVNTNHFKVSTILTLGYRTKQPREKTRQDFNEVIQYIE